MKILVVNAGSSSMKYTVYEFSTLDDLKVLAKGQVECIGLEESFLIYEKPGLEKEKSVVQIPDGKKVVDHVDSFSAIFNRITDADTGVVKDRSEIVAIGHRAVHGGEKITKSMLVDDELKNIMTECISLAPLHNPPNLAGIEACESVLPGVPNVGVFDTAFHQSMKPEAFLYAIPYELYQEKGIRKYGFHGTSHRYVAEKASEYLGKPMDELKLITCHIGNGASITAIDKGKVVDTSMGLTPLEGLVMGTRSGDVDPGVILHLANTGMSIPEIDKLLNKQSGLLGLSQTGTSDMRGVMAEADKGNEKAKLALDIFVRRIIKYIGAYVAVLNGADAIVFTGGVGENCNFTRKSVAESLEYLGVKFNHELNNNCRGRKDPVDLALDGSSMKLLVIPTDEELMIAKESITVLKEKSLL